jgi:hypothetical protein
MLRPDHSHVRDYISELGETGAPYAGWVNLAGFLPIGLLVLLFIFTASKLMPVDRRSALLSSSVGWAYLVASVFPCDPGCPGTCLASPLAKSEFSKLWGDLPLRYAQVMASAKGFGPDWGTGLEEDGITLRLVEEGPAIRGRIMDGDGRPVAGATVSVLQIRTSQEENLAAWAEALKTGKEARVLENQFLRKAAFMNLLGHVLSPLETGTDGLFVLKGVPCRCC